MHQLEIYSKTLKGSRRLNLNPLICNITMPWNIRPGGMRDAMLGNCTLYYACMFLVWSSLDTYTEHVLLVWNKWMDGVTVWRLLPSEEKNINCSALESGRTLGSWLCTSNYLVKVTREIIEEIHGAFIIGACFYTSFECMPTSNQELKRMLAWLPGCLVV